jgi:hypothetical protein
MYSGSCFHKAKLHPEIGGLAGAMSDLKEPQTISLIDEDRKRAKPFNRLRCGTGTGATRFSYPISADRQGISRFFSGNEETAPP